MSFQFTVSPPDGTSYSGNPLVTCSFDYSSLKTSTLSLGTGQTTTMSPAVTCTVLPTYKSGNGPVTSVSCSTASLPQSNSLTLTLGKSDPYSSNVLVPSTYGSCTLTPK